MQDIVETIIEKLPVYGAFIASLIALAVFLDLKTKIDLKTKLADRIYGYKAGGNKPLLGQMPAFFEVASSIFGAHSFVSFVRRTALISVAILACLILLQALISETAFNRTTAPFLKAAVTFSGPAVLILAGVLQLT